MSNFLEMAAVDFQISLKYRTVGKATGVFRKLQKIWSLSFISTRIKLQIYNTVVLPRALYASETLQLIRRFSPEIPQKNIENIPS